MTVLCTVVFDRDVETMTASEEAHPEIIGKIGEYAQQYMLSHERYAREGQTMDVDTYRSEEDYHAFVELAGSTIQRYCEAAGATVVDTLWTKQ